MNGQLAALGGAKVSSVSSPPGPDGVLVSLKCGQSTYGADCSKTCPAGYTTQSAYGGLVVEDCNVCAAGYAGAAVFTYGATSPLSGCSQCVDAGSVVSSYATGLSTCPCASGYAGLTCSSCATGYAGTSCSQCDVGYTAFGSSCTACPNGLTTPGVGSYTLCSGST